jgi:hypothetical protein
MVQKNRSAPGSTFREENPAEPFSLHGFRGRFTSEALKVCDPTISYTSRPSYRTMKRR